MERFSETGFATIPIFTQDEISLLRSKITNASLNFPMYNGDSIPDPIAFPEFAFLKDIIEDSRIVNNVKAALGPNIRFVGHNDIGFNRVVGWHKDRLNNQYNEYEKTPIWGPEAMLPNTGFGIVKVAIYFQDHSSNNHAMKVIPNSYKTPAPTVIRSSSHYVRNQTILQLKPKIGEILIFEQRSTHRGQVRPTNSETNSPLRNSRILLSIGYGRKNVFSDEFERGTVARQTDQKSMLKTTKKQTKMETEVETK